MASFSLTVVGGNTVNSGLVNVPVTFSGADSVGLQSVLSVLSSFDTVAGTDFTNFNAAGLSGNETFGAGSAVGGLFEITNTNGDGSTVAGSADIQVTVPSGYNALVVQVPGTVDITGNNANNVFALFGSQSTVTYTQLAGSGEVFASGGDNILLDGSAFSVVGGTGGNNDLNVLSDTGAVTTEGGADNVIFIAGITDSVLSEGSNDFIGAAATNGSITVTGFANVIGTNGSTTVTATGTGSINAFIDAGYAGTLEFINNSSSASTVTGLAGSVTVFGGAGGGHYEGGGLGHNYLYGGFMPSVAGSAGLATLDGSGAGNDTLIVAGSTSGAGFNVINAGGQDSLGNVTTGGNQYLASTSTAGTTYFHLNEGIDTVVAAGGGTQYFFLSSTGEATISGSKAATMDQYYLAQSTAPSSVTDVIENFRVSKDNFSIVNSPHVSITGVQNYSISNQTGSFVNLSNGTRIQLVGVSANSVTVTGHTSF